MPKADLLHLADRVFGTPLLVTREKGEVILTVLADRLGITPPLAEIPATPEREASGYQIVDGVAVIPVVGTLVNKAGSMDALSGMTSYSSIAAQLDQALADPRVEGVLLDVDSPGGECAGNFELAQKVFAARSVKPIHAVANPMAASAAYAIAAAAEILSAPPVSTTGSIGVITFHRDESKANESRGVKVTAITAGARKADGWTPLTEAAHAALQERVDGIYDLFVDSVAKSRGMKPAAVRATEAGVFLGAEAKARGLIDRIGGKVEALAALHAQIKEPKMKELSEALARITVLEADVAKVTGERDALGARILEFESAVAKRQADDDLAFLELLRTESATLQAPIDPAKIAKVEAHLKAGRREFALEFGAELLEGARARAGKPVAPKGARPLLPPGPNQKTDAQLEAELLENRGWSVTLNAEKTEILSASPLGKTGKG